jgi:hypothetical protein
MYTRQIQRALLSDPKALKYYGGVLPADKLPVWVLDRPKYYVVNVDPSNKSGKHWVVFYMDTLCEYFDPIGHPPEFYHKEWQNFLIRNGPKYLMNTTRIQNFNSDKCGDYCIYYCKLRCRNVSMHSILSLFCGKSLEENDEIIKYVNKNSE